MTLLTFCSHTCSHTIVHTKSGPKHGFRLVPHASAPSHLLLGFSLSHSVPLPLPFLPQEQDRCLFLSLPPLPSPCPKSEREDGHQHGNALPLYPARAIANDALQPPPPSLAPCHCLHLPCPATRHIANPASPAPCHQHRSLITFPFLLFYDVSSIVT